MSRETFDAGWLALREPVDHRARAGALLAPLRAWWTASGARHVVDLGAGAGSNLRYLAPEVPGPQEWTLVDHDEALLLRAGEGRGAGQPGSPSPGDAAPDLRVRTVAADLASSGLDHLGDAHLVTASALLDLVSREWIEHVADTCTEQGAAALFALTYDGTAGWSDVVGLDAESRRESVDDAVEPVDALVLDAVNRHQQGDKGFGPALGPDAARVADQAFRGRGYHTRLEASPWELGADDAALVEHLVAGWVEAASELLPSEADRFAEWGERRKAAIREGRVRLTVGHLDLLALPPDPPGTSRPMSGPPRRWKTAARFVVSATLLLLVARFVDVGDVLTRLRELRPGWLGLGLALSVLQVLLLGWRWAYTAGRLGVVLPLRTAVAEYYLGVLLNQVLPGGVTGDVSRAWRHSRRDAPARPVVTAVVLERASGQAVMTAVAVISLLTLPWGPGWLRLVLGVVVALWLTLIARAVVRRLPTDPEAEGLPADVRRVFLGDALTVQLGTAVLVVASYIVVFLVAARAVGVDTSLVRLLPLVAPVLMTMLIPVTVAGWGIREAAAAGLWGLVGLTPADGAAISVAYGLLVLLSSLPGALVLMGSSGGPPGGRDRRGRPPPA